MSEVPGKGLPKTLRRAISVAFSFVDDIIVMRDKNPDGLAYPREYAEYYNAAVYCPLIAVPDKSALIEHKPLEALLVDDLDYLSVDGCWTVMAVTHPTVHPDDADKLLQLLPSVGHKGNPKVVYTPDKLVEAISSIWQYSLTIRNKAIGDSGTELWKDYYTNDVYKLRLLPWLGWNRDAEPPKCPTTGINKPHFRIGKSGFAEEYMKASKSCYEALMGQHATFMYGARALGEFLPCTMMQRLSLCKEDDDTTMFVVEATAFTGPGAEERARRFLRLEQRLIMEATAVRLNQPFQYTSRRTPWTYSKMRLSGIWGGQTMPIDQDYVNEINCLGGIPLYSDIVLHNEEVSPPDDTPMGEARRLLLDQHQEDAASFLLDGCW